MTLCNPLDYSTLGSSVLYPLLEFAQTHSTKWVMLSNYLILCSPFHLLSSIFPCIGVFPKELAIPIRWPKYWSFSLASSPSNEYSGLISYRIDHFDYCTVQGNLKESFPAPQFESINSSALSLLYGPTLKYIHDYWKNDNYDYMDLTELLVLRGIQG